MSFQQLASGQEIEKDAFVQFDMVSCSSTCLIFINIVLVSVSSFRPEFRRHRDTLLVMFLLGDLMSYNLEYVQMKPKQTLFNLWKRPSRVCLVNNRLQHFLVLLMDTATIFVTNVAVRKMNPIVMVKISSKIFFFVLNMVNASSWAMAFLAMSLVQRSFCFNALYGETDEYWFNVRVIWSSQDLTALLAFFRAIFTVLSICFHFLSQNIREKEIVFI